MKLGKVFEGCQRPTSYSIDARAFLNMTRSNQRDHRQRTRIGYGWMLLPLGTVCWRVDVANVGTNYEIPDNDKIGFGCGLTGLVTD